MSVSETENQSNIQPTSQSKSQSVSEPARGPATSPSASMPRSCGKQGATILSAGPKSISSPSGFIRNYNPDTDVCLRGARRQTRILRRTFCRVWKISFAVWCSINCKFSPPVSENTQLLSSGSRFSLLYRKHGCSRFPEKLVNSVRLHGFIQEGTILQNHLACYWTVTFNIKKRICLTNNSHDWQHIVLFVLFALNTTECRLQIMCVRSDLFSCMEEHVSMLGIFMSLELLFTSE